MISNMFIIFLLIQNIIFTVFNLPEVFSYWDETFFLILVSYYFIIKFNGKIEIEKLKLLSAILLSVLIGLLGNLVFQFSINYNPIIRDIINYLKFPLTVYVLLDTNILAVMSKKIDKIMPIIKLLIIVITLTGIISLFVDLGMSQEEIRGGIHPFYFLFLHPTYLVTFLSICLCLINTIPTKKIYLYEFLLIFDIILAMRTKGFALVAVYVFVKYFSKYIRKISIIYWISLVSLITYTAWYKLVLYSTFSSSPRETLYKGAFELMKICFPIGSGFGTYASYISGKYFSSVYNKIIISGLYNPDGSISAAIGDAGFPYYLGQFGIIGTICFIYIVYKMYKIYIKPIQSKNRFPITIYTFLIIISLTSEAILVNNGFEIGFIFALIIYLCKIRKDGKLFEKSSYSNVKW